MRSSKVVEATLVTPIWRDNSESFSSVSSSEGSGPPEQTRHRRTSSTSAVAWPLDSTNMSLVPYGASTRGVAFQLAMTSRWLKPGSLRLSTFRFSGTRRCVRGISTESVRRTSRVELVAATFILVIPSSPFLADQAPRSRPGDMNSASSRGGHLRDVMGKRCATPDSV